MAEEVLAALGKEFRLLMAPKLLAEAKAAQVVWARVKGYPAWPAQVLTEAAALRRKDLGQERHSKGNSVPVMFFGTVEVAWVKDADIVDFKEGLYQGFFDRKTKHFRLALEQVCEYLALDRKRKAPPKWWCKPPSNGLDEQSDGPSLKLLYAPGSGATKGAVQRHVLSKGSRQRVAAPESDAGTSSEAEDAPATQTAGGRTSGRATAGKEGTTNRLAKDAEALMPALKPWDCATGRVPRDNGSTAVSTNTAAQMQARKLPMTLLAAPTRQSVVSKASTPASDGDKVGKDARQGAPSTADDAKAAPASQTSQQQHRLKSCDGATMASPKENAPGLPPRKRLKVERLTVGPTAASGSSLPPPVPPVATAKRAFSAGEVSATVMNEVDVLKLPAEIRRLAGIRLPALPKKPGIKVEESPREQSLPKVEPAATSTAAKGPVVASKSAAAGEGGASARPRRSGSATQAVQPEVLRSTVAAPGKRTRQSFSGADSQSVDSSDVDDESLNSSGEDAESEGGASSSDESDVSEEESEEDTVVAAEQRRSRAAVTTRSRGQSKCAMPLSEPPPARDRKGEKQRRLARLSAPEPMTRRTSSRLLPKPQDAVSSKKAVGDDNGEGSESEKATGNSVEGEDERSSFVKSSSGDGSSSGESESEAQAGKESSDGVVGLRSRTRAALAMRMRPQRNLGLASRMETAVPRLEAPSRDAILLMDSRTRTKATCLSAGAKHVDEDKRPQQREGSSASAPLIRALPLELRRLQSSQGAGTPAVDTKEPRTLRDRSSPALRNMGAAGFTPTNTATAGASTGGRHVDKRASEDGSGASIVEHSRSPEHPQDGQKSGSDVEAIRPQRSTRSRPLDGRSSKASSVAGSASPPPAPMTGAVPVQKKPPSLGVPSTAVSAGQGTIRQLPAITPARGFPRSLVSSSDTQPSSAPPTTGCGGSSAGGTLLVPAAVCLPKKPSSGPPTRRLVESALDAPLLTDLTYAVLECEAEAKHVLPADVAITVAAAASDGCGKLRRSLDTPSWGGAGVQAHDVAPVECQQPTQSRQVELTVECQPGMQSELSAGRQVEQDVSMSDAAPSCAVMQLWTVSGADVQESKLLVGKRDALEAIAGDSQQRLEQAPGQGHPEMVDAQRSSCLQQALTVTLTEPVEQAAALTSRSSVAHDQDFEPATCLLERALSTPLGQQATFVQAACALGPQARSYQGSPTHDALLLSEEQLSNQGEAMAEHDGRSAVQAERLNLWESGSAGGFDPPGLREGAVALFEAARDIPAMPSPAVTSVQGHVANGNDTMCVEAPLPCAGSRASSEAGCGDGAPAGVSRASCSAVVWAEEDDAAARAHAHELEELGEVAAALAGLHQADVPRLPLTPSELQPALGPLADSLQADSLLDRSRSRGSKGVPRINGSPGGLLGGGSALLSCFRWPQPEPLLPSQEQAFSLPHDWLLTRPPRYETVKRNIWLSRLKPKRLPKDEISICACRPPLLSAPGELQRMGCGSNCLNRLSSVLCDAKLCPCGELCSNRSLHLLRQPKTEVFITENRGWGVRTMEPMSKSTFIIEYAGEVIDERELGRRMDHARMNGEPHFYIMELSPGLYIDARRKGNIARLINSSCDPNCETQKWHDASTGEVRVGIFATRDIAPGEELVYDYFFSTYGALKPSAASFVCMCGSKNCRGTMDLHPEKRRDLGRRVEVFWDADGQYYRAVIVAYHPTSKKHTVMYEDGGTEKLSLNEVPHRWMDEEQPLRTSLRKSDVLHGDSSAAALVMTSDHLSHQLLQRQSDAQLSKSEQLQPLRPQVVAADIEMTDMASASDAGRCVPIVAVAPPRPYVPIDQRCLLPPLGGTAIDTAYNPSTGQQSRHRLQESELQLPLKKRQRMMQHRCLTAQQHPLSLPSTPSQALGASSRTGEALPSAAQPQASGGSADCAAPPAYRPTRNSGGGDDSAGGDMDCWAGHASLRHESSVTASGRISSVVADEDDPNEDLDSLLEAAEAVAALRTAPISNPSVLQTRHDSVLSLQPRHVRSGSVAATGADATIAMVQTAKVASPRHLAAVQRAGPPNGLPPHGGSRPSGAYTAHPSSSSSGFIPYQADVSRQHPSGNGTAYPQAANDGGFSGPYEHQQHGRNGRFSGEHEAGAAPGVGSRRKNGNGCRNGYGSHANGDINREDLLWKLVGIEKPKDLLPLFAGGNKSRDGDNAKGRNGASDTWIAPSHPYGKLLRALEASELLPHADQLRLFAHQQSQQQQLPQNGGTQQQLVQQQQLAVPHAQPLQQQTKPQAQQQLLQANAAVGSASTSEALALSAWQQLAQQQIHQHSNGLDSGSVAAFLHHAQQQHAAAAAVAAAAAMAASGGQLHQLHALQGHASHSGATVAAIGLPGHMSSQQPLATAAATAASHWQQSVHAQPGSIIQDLVQMYVAQHATGSHPMLAMAGTTTVGGPRV